MQSPIHARDLDQLFTRYPRSRPLWIVDVSRQRIHRREASGLIHSAPVSTSRFGLGDRPGSHWTPLGLHEVTEIIGAAAPAGQRFESRRPVGNPLPSGQWRHGEGDAILSRILWLEGREACNRHSHERFIYLHGTHQEEQLGRPASHGCIRLANRTIIDWVDALDGQKPWVWIGRLVTSAS